MPSNDDQLPEPADLIVVRHGESLANVAFRDAEASGTPVELVCRDADVALSPTGSKQAVGLGHWLRDQRPPEVVYCSPYLRARQTWQIAAGELPEKQCVLPLVIDERLRDREMGQLELHTPAMVCSRYPEQAQRRARVGEFYYRPPGGESLGDVARRLRSFLRDVERTRQTLVIAHDAVVLLMRYITESLPEEGLQQVPHVANASVSRWEMSMGKAPRLITYNEVRHLSADDQPPSGLSDTGTEVSR